jgi:hypothetical protein
MAGACRNCNKWLTAPEMGRPCPDCGSMDRIVFGIDSATADDREAVGREIAHKHFEIEAGLTHVFWINSPVESESSSTEPIKLLEVNEFTVPSGIVPLQFAPSRATGVSFPSIIVEVTPQEFAKIQTGELQLPNGWSLGHEIPKTNGEEAR